jgi:hypothetical protein
VAPRQVDTYSDLAADFAAAYGLVPDDWQQVILDDWLAVGPKGRWASLKCGLSVPRQNGKNGALEIRELFGAVGRGERILHTAHQVKTAMLHFRRLKHFFGSKVNDPNARYPELNALVKEMTATHGREAIYLKNGASIEIVARSQGSGRGYTVDVIVCDEAQDMSDDDLEALLSASSAGPLGDPQWIFTGTPPGPRVDGSVFTRNRTEATTGGRRGRKVSWLEWAADPKDDPADPATWEKANPGLTTGRLLFDVVEAEYGTFSPGGFARERLGIWPEVAASARVIPGETWAALAKPGPVNGTPPTSLAVDASHDRVLVIAACWTIPGEDRNHVEIVHLDPSGDTLAAVNWLVERARPKRIPVFIDAMSPAASMIPALKTSRVQVKQTSSGDMAKACGLLVDDASSGRLSHGITDENGTSSQAPLDAALAGAKKRAIGTAGGWGWDRKDPAVNIAPLVAVSLARLGASTVRPKSTSSDRSSNGRTAILL